jgi:hypothetical protein
MGVARVPPVLDVRCTRKSFRLVDRHREKGRGSDVVAEAGIDSEIIKIAGTGTGFGSVLCRS